MYYPSDIDISQIEDERTLTDERNVAYRCRLDYVLYRDSLRPLLYWYVVLQATILAFFTGKANTVLRYLDDL